MVTNYDDFNFCLKSYSSDSDCTNVSCKDQAYILPPNCYYSSRISLDFTLEVMENDMQLSYLDYASLYHSDSLGKESEDNCPYVYIPRPQNSQRFWDSLSIVVWVIIGIVAGGCLVLCGHLAVWLIYKRWKREKMKMKMKIEKAVKAAIPRIVVSNALGVVITIGDYEHDENIDNAELNDVYLRDLPVERDYDNLKELFQLYNYKMIPPYQLHWKEKDVMQFLKTDVVQELFDEMTEKVKYDSLIVCLSCHGLQNSIITSDYKQIEKTVIHRVISHHPKLRDIPRLFIYDSCNGSGQRERKDDSDSEESQSIHKGNKNIAKSVKLSEISDGYEWLDGDMNPDYNLCQIHAANDGFQAFCDSVTGSYLTTSFVNKMQDNINEKRNKTLGALCDEIQSKLHDMGKQQTTNIFNSNTQHLEFQVHKKLEATTQTSAIEMTNI
eukprot:66223_1